MAIVLDHNFSGTSGSTFAGNAVFAVLLGTQTIQDTAHAAVKALRFAAGTQSIVQASISGGPTTRTMSRIGKISAAPTATSEILQVRSSSARGAGLQVLGTSGNIGKLRIVDPNGTALTGGGTSSGAVPIGSEFRYSLSIAGTSVVAVAWTDTSAGATIVATCSATVSASTAMAFVRDGLITSGGFGAGISFDVSWPQDSDTTTDPGPRNYGTLGSSTLVFDHDWDGATGAQFAGDDFYTVVAGAAPTYVRTSRGGKALRFPDEQSIIQHAFSSVTSRVFSRIYRLNAPVAARSEILQTRIGTARGPAVAFTENNKMLLMRTDGSAVETTTVDLPVGVEFRVTFIVAGTSISALLFLNDTTLTVADSVSGTLPAGASMTFVREGVITSTGLGQDVTLDLIWPQEDSANDPGPRTYPFLPGRSADHQRRPRPGRPRTVAHRVPGRAGHRGRHPNHRAVLVPDQRAGRHPGRHRREPRLRGARHPRRRHPAVPVHRHHRVRDRHRRRRPHRAAGQRARRGRRGVGARPDAVAAGRRLDAGR